MFDICPTVDRKCFIFVQLLIGNIVDLSDLCKKGLRIAQFK